MVSTEFRQGDQVENTSNLTKINAIPSLISRLRDTPMYKARMRRNTRALTSKYTHTHMFKHTDSPACVSLREMTGKYVSLISVSNHSIILSYLN